MTKGRLAWALVVVLAILHYDFWYWADGSLVFGFMPIGLLYQVLISVAAGIVWALVATYAWPTWVEKWAEAGEDES